MGYGESLHHHNTPVKYSGTAWLPDASPYRTSHHLGIGVGSQYLGTCQSTFFYRQKNVRILDEYCFY